MNEEKLNKDVAKKSSTKKPVEKKSQAKKASSEKKAPAKAEKSESKPLVKIRVDDREAEWLKAFETAGYQVSIDKKHVNLTVKTLGMHFAIQKNSIVPYISFSNDEQLAGLNKLFAVKKYGYTISMPAKRSEKGDSRFRAVASRTDNEIELALELVAKIKEIKAKQAKAKKSEEVSA